MPFGTGKGLERSPSQALSKARDSMLAYTAFLGDLYAMGIVSRTAIQTIIREFARNPRCLLHMRALYLLLSRCVETTRDRISVDFLVGYGQELPKMLAFYRGAADNTAQQWRMVSVPVIAAR